MVKELEDQAQKDAAAEKAAEKTSTKKYNRKKGDDLGGGVKAGSYRKSSVDETLPKILQDLITKQREAREIIRTQDASRYGELPQLYADIRSLEQKRDKVIKQVSNPVDDNKDTEYVEKQYKEFLAGKPAHHSVKGKKDKYDFKSKDKEFTANEIKFAMTSKSAVPNLNKAGLASKQQTRDRFGNALTIPDDMSQGEETAAPKTKEEAEKAKKEQPADRSKREEAEAAQMEADGYDAYKKSTFDDKGNVSSFSREYVEWATKNKVSLADRKAFDKKYQKRYKEKDFIPENKPPRPAPQQQPGGLRGSGRRSGTKGRSSDTEGVSEGSSSTDPPKTQEAEVGADGSSKTTDKTDKPSLKGAAADADGEVGGTDPPLTTPPGTPPPFKDEEEKQEERDKLFDRTETKEGQRPGTLEEFEVLGASRAAPPIETPMTNEILKPSDIAKARSDDVAKENKQRGKASIERLKEEIRAYHLVYDNNIKEFRENPHKKQKNDALESDDIEVVRAHHKKMEETIREYYRGGDADSLNVGVIVPIDTYLQQYLSRSTPQFSNIQPPPAAQSTASAGATHRHQHLTKKGHDAFGHAIAASTYYQRGGIGSYKQQPVANHTIRIKSAATSSAVPDPKVYVDAPLNNFLQRPLKLSSSLKIKS